MAMPQELFPSLITDQKLTELIDKQLVIGNYKSALFWASKRLALFDSQDYDVVNLGTSPLELARYLKVLTAASEWQSVITMISKTNLQTRHIIFAYYYANALFQINKHEDIAAMPLGNLIELEGYSFVAADFLLSAHMSNVRRIDVEMERALEDMSRTEDVSARMLFLLSRTFDILQNRPSAKIFAEAAIRLNPFLIEAIEFVIEKHLLTAEFIRTIVTEVEIFAEDEPLRDVILLLLERYDHYPGENTNQELAALDRILNTDSSILHARATYYHSRGYFEDAYEVTSKIIEMYGVAHKCLHLHLACCVELRKATIIYEISHILATTALDDPRTFYAVGCYYLTARQYEQAKDFFRRCVTTYPYDGYSWIAYGHALAMCHEHEQSMNCYMRATRYLEHFFEPMLYIGIQYVHSNSLQHAEQALQRAQNLSSEMHPMIWHETATLLIMQRRFNEAYQQYYTALKILTRTLDENIDFLDLINEDFDSYWSPLLFNMGFVLFCSKKYCKAISCFKRVLILGFEASMTNAHIGYCYLASGRPSYGIEALRKTLAKEPTMLMAKRAYDRATFVSASLPSTLKHFTDDELDKLLADIPPFDPRKVDTRPNVAVHLLPDTLQQASLRDAQSCYQRHRSGKLPTSEAASGTGDNTIKVGDGLGSSGGTGSSGETTGLDSAVTQETVLEPEGEGDAEVEAEEEVEEEEEEEEEEGPMSSAQAANLAAAAAAAAVSTVSTPRTPTPRVSPILNSPSSVTIPRRLPPAPLQTTTTRFVPMPDPTETYEGVQGSPSNILTGVLYTPTDRHAPVLDIDDPHTLLSNMLIDDLYFDTVRIPDETLEELRPEPNPRPNSGDANQLPVRVRPHLEPRPYDSVYPWRY